MIETTRKSRHTHRRGQKDMHKQMQTDITSSTSGSLSVVSCGIITVDSFMRGRYLVHQSTYTTTG